MTEGRDPLMVGDWVPDPWDDVTALAEDSTEVEP
ncbi:MAG: hypothetical protein RJB57_135, partial [Actinomycetota bacterium]